MLPWWSTAQGLYNTIVPEDGVNAWCSTEDKAIALILRHFPHSVAIKVSRPTN